MTERLSIGERINAVRKKLEYLKKEKNVMNQYKVVTHDQVTAEIRPWLIEYGIITVLKETSRQLDQTGKATKSGVPITAFIATYDIDFCCTDDVTDKVTATISAIGEDHGDKGPGQAASYAMKTIMLKMFNVVTGENDERRVESKPFVDPSIMTVTQRTEIINRGLDINDSVERKDIESAVIWYTKKEGLAKGSTEIHKHCIGIPGIEQIFEEYTKSQQRQPGEDG